MVVRVAVMIGVLVVVMGLAAAAQGSPPHVTGPRLIALGDNAEIDLPAGMILYDRADAQRFLNEVGEPSDGVLAIVHAPDAGWTVILSYADAGYVSDADAGELDAGALLAEYRAGNHAQNAQRRRFANPELVIDGWAEPPRYERAQHRLVWGLAAHTADGKLVNLFTRILGRHGFLSVSLIDTAETIDLSKLEAQSIVRATRFTPGARYEDHAPGDRGAGSGLRGLVLGSTGIAVASKLGVLTKVMLGLENAILFVLLGALAVGELVRRWFRRRPGKAPAG
jgi:uncharacterized membrane-anchored protein